MVGEQEWILKGNITSAIYL
jgi:hypothetical protein